MLWSTLWGNKFPRMTQHHVLSLALHRGGRCMMYQGQVCQKALNETLTEFTDTPRFFDNAFGQILTEQFLSLVTSVIQAQVDSNPRCNFILRNMLCHYTLPPCFPNKTPMDFCREDCESIFQECSASINMVIGAVKFYVSQKNIDFVHTALPNCSRHAYYKADNSCIHTGFFGEDWTPCTAVKQLDIFRCSTCCLEHFVTLFPLSIEYIQRRQTASRFFPNKIVVIIHLWFWTGETGNYCSYRLILDYVIRAAVLL